MDTSKEYIKMCDCKEIQNHEWEDGDFLIYKRDFHNSDIYHNWCISKGDNDIYRRGNGGNEYVVGEIGAIWLPQQGQLQEMSDWSWNYFDSLCAENALEYAIQEKPTVDKKMLEDSFWQLCSKEVAGILTLMKEKHNKTWNKDKWIG